jgi:tetratricopeptide (TPR) repeat protein
MRQTILVAFILAAPLNVAAGAGYDDLNVAISYFDQEQYDNAISWFDKAIAANDLTPDLMRLAYLDRGLSHSAKSETQKAIADYGSAIATKPDDMLAYRERISAYLASADLEKALTDYESLRRLRPHDYDILMNIGWLNWQLNHIEASADAFFYFAQVDPYCWLWLQLANVRQGKPMTEYTEDAEARKWPGHLPRFYRGHLSESDVLEAAKSIKGRNALCFGYAFTAMWRVVHNDQTGATPLLQSATEQCAKGSPYWNIVRAELNKVTSGDGAK